MPVRSKSTKKAPSRSQQRMVQDALKEARKTVRLIAKMKRLGASDYEISKALDVDEEDLSILS